MDFSTNAGTSSRDFTAAYAIRMQPPSASSKAWLSNPDRAISSPDCIKTVKEGRVIPESEKPCTAHCRRLEASAADSTEVKRATKKGPCCSAGSPPEASATSRTKAHSRTDSSQNAAECC